MSASILSPGQQRLRPFMIREQFSLPEGPVEILSPDILSPDSVAEVAEWLHLLERKMRRWSDMAELARIEQEKAIEDLKAVDNA